MELKSKNSKVSAKFGTTVSAKAQPSSLRHHRASVDKAAPQRADSSNPRVLVLSEGFERRSDHIADNKRGQVYIVQRLSDPQNKAAVADRMEAISAEKAKALEFLRSIGVASATGRLTARFGG